MQIEFSAEIWYWRGPSPYFFVTVPAQECKELKIIASRVSYGWGMIPALVRIGGVEWKTSLFPKDGSYIVPLKDSVRKAEQLEAGDTVTVRLAVN
ncbi:MAG TPA: DUF1905 domain-containing protein [Chloroflexi bacterium]|nr:DUF1905 domain-containing protein [Chloroflexota bacterium]HHW87924.1 DUF1905 domain-containing protein [Chloroflexota bacterium]